MAIIHARKPFTKEESLDALEHYVREWFERSFNDLTPPQLFSFKLISRKRNVIIAAPTGSGKTLAGFMTILSELFKIGEKGKLKQKVYCIYISPLKALDNDVKKNLLVPLKEIREIAKEKGIELPEVDVGLRTGDVSPAEKSKQLRKPPHILITTPESLAIMLNAPKFVEHLREVRWIIVDEIHELASNKRGTHLSLSIERLQEFVGREFVRIGLGATLHPLKEAAKYLVGYSSTKKLRSCTIIDVSWSKKFDLKVVSPVSDLINTPAQILNEKLYEFLDRYISGHEVTLIFTNTRSGTEKVVYGLKERWPEKYNDSSIAAHHGSLGRDTRLDVEDRLKRGELKAVVSSTSLELGIDIGSVDLVVQIGSPKSTTRAVQRIGRAGHRVHRTAKGRVIALDRNDLVETTVMLKNAMEKKLDKIQIPKNALDILAQHIVGMSLTRKWDVEEAFEVIKRSYPYNDLNPETFKKLLHYLAGHYAELQDRKVYGKIWYEPDEGTFGRRGKYTRIIYYLNLGAIPDEVKVGVYLLPEKRHLGGIEEEFLEKLKKQDIFVLGGKPYKFRYSRGMRCYVEKVPPSTSPTIPAWFSEMLPLSFDLAMEIQKFRSKLAAKLKKSSKEDAEKWLLKNYPVSHNAARAILDYFWLQSRYSLIPGTKDFLVEDTYDEGRHYLVFHSLFGRRVNDVLSRAFASIISKKIKHSVAIVVSDNGFALQLPSDKNVNLEDVFKELLKSDLKELIMKTMENTELLRRRFRHCAARSFLVLRNYRGYKISVAKQQVSSQTLLKVLKEIDEDFPVIQETYREILQDVLDIHRAEKVIGWLREGRLILKKTETPVPSPFSHNLILLGEADIIQTEDRKSRLLALHRLVMEKIKNIEA
ncbi:DEAD-box ATP-dependent RNA helicase CshA [archaeon BMS3Bbin15]|nr:DEAD-box ATP-dependent RNA helicase CshA [archaeon BMS3Bbin15]